MFFQLNTYSSDVFISGYSLEGRLDGSGNTAYDKLLNSFFINYPQYKKNYHIIPIARGKKALLSKKHACILPSNIMALRVGFPKFESRKLIQSKSIEIVLATLFSRHGEKPIQNLEELKNKVVVGWRGVNVKNFLQEYLKPNGKIVEVSSGIDAIKFLNLKRADYMVAYVPDTPILIKKYGMKPLPYNSKVSYGRIPVSLLCNDTAITRRLISLFDKHLDKLINNGTLKELLGPYSILPKNL